MSHLPQPIRRALDASVTEAEVHGIWRRIQQRRRPEPRKWAWATAGALAIAVVALFARELLPKHVADAGPLELVTAAATAPLARGTKLTTTTELSDGSRVRVASGTDLSVLENTSRAFLVLLTRGRAEFAVEPGGPRRWIIECADVSVEVVGTEFAVERTATTVRVDVRHGVVLARGSGVPNGVERLTAGQSLELTIPGGVTLPKTIASAPAPPAPESDGLDGGSPAAALPASRAPTMASGSASADPAAELDALLVAADQARRSGNTREAADLLERAIARQPVGHRAALSAFTLGRLYLEELGNPARAAVAFERALSAGAPGDLEEDVRARLVEARVSMSDEPGARRAADAYRARFPTGRRRADVDRQSPPE